MTESVAMQVDTSVPERLWSACERVWDVPMLLATGWWTMAVDAACPTRCRHTIFRDCDRQLVVPGPFAADTEPCLFA